MRLINKPRLHRKHGCSASSDELRFPWCKPLAGGYSGNTRMLHVRGRLDKVVTSARSQGLFPLHRYGSGSSEPVRFLDRTVHAVYTTQELTLGEPRIPILRSSLMSLLHSLGDYSREAFGPSVSGMRVAGCSHVEQEPPRTRWYLDTFKRTPVGPYRCGWHDF